MKGEKMTCGRVLMVFIYTITYALYLRFFFFYFVCTVHGQDVSYIYWEIYIYASFTIHPHGLWLRWNLIQIIPIRSVPRVDSSPQPPTGALKLLNESTSSSVNYCQKWWQFYNHYLKNVFVFPSKNHTLGI